MTQEIVYRCPDGIVLASDSLVVRIDESGRRDHASARKIFPLGRWAALLTAGAFRGVQISQRFAQWAEAEGLEFLEDLGPAALEVFEKEYQSFIQENEAWFAAHPQAYRSLYVLLAGWSRRSDSAAWEILFLSSEEHRLPFQVLPVGDVLTIPRRLGLEGQLMARLKWASSLEDVASFCHSALGVLTERDPGEVGGPFYTAILDGEGFRWWNRATPEG